MSRSSDHFEIGLDPRNPGQFFACCGVLEIAHRLWPETEGWFVGKGDVFALSSGRGAGAEFRGFLEVLKQLSVTGLSEKERDELECLEEQKRNAKRGGAFSKADEERRKQLGTRAREGALRLQHHGEWEFRLDWWQQEETPKTWAGRQEVGRVARAAQAALPDSQTPHDLFNYGCVLRAEDGKKAVEPFYFDARRFSSALDTGFSLDVVGAETIAHPAVELLALIGLQRFRPMPAGKWSFDYWTWGSPLAAPVATVVACGAVPTTQRQRYHFPLRFRDDQKRYKAFGIANHIGEDG